MSARSIFRRRRNGQHAATDAPAETPPGDSPSLLLQPPGEQARAEAARIVAQVEAEEQAELDRTGAGAGWQQAPASPVHMIAGADGIRPCCGLPAFQVPPADYETRNPQLVTCHTAAHDTMLDNRAPMARGYVPGPYAPDLRADIRDLPFFRDVIEWHAQRLHAGCECKWVEEDKAGWYAGQYAHIIPAVPVLSWWAFRPAQDEARTAESEVAA